MALSLQQRSQRAVNRLLRLNHQHKALNRVHARLVRAKQWDALKEIDVLLNRNNANFLRSRVVLDTFHSRMLGHSLGFPMPRDERRDAAHAIDCGFVPTLEPAATEC